MQVLHLQECGIFIRILIGILEMQDYTMELFYDLEGLLNSETITGNSVFRILKKHASTVSVFDMMRFTSQVMEENRYVQESYREDSQKSYIESFLMRVRDISNDNKILQTIKNNI